MWRISCCYTAEVQCNCGHSRTNRTASLSGMRHLYNIFSRWRCSCGWPHDVWSIMYCCSWMSEAVVEAAHMGMIQRGGWRSQIVERIVILLKSKFSDSIGFLFLPDENVVNHRATTKDYPQTNEDTRDNCWR